MKKVIISGASGNIGKELLKIIDNPDYKVYAFTSDREKLSEFKNIIPVMNNDFSNLNEDLSNSIFINLAFPRRNDIELINAALDFTREIYAKLISLGCKKIVNISSQSVYDRDRKEEASEETTPIPFNLYGYAKFYFEEYTKKFCLENDANFINLRLGSVVGSGTEVRINNQLIKAYLNDEDIQLNLNESTYSYIDILDVAQALKSIIDESDNLKWDTNYNLGTQFEYTEEEIFNSIKKLIKKEYKGNISYNKNEIRKTNKINVDKLYSIISWRPKHDLDSTNKNILLKQYNLSEENNGY